MSLLENIQFHAHRHMPSHCLSRMKPGLRFTRPGQVVQQHNAPHSPVFVTVLRGQGLFAGADGVAAFAIAHL